MKKTVRKKPKYKPVTKKKYDKPGQPTKYSPDVIGKVDIYLSMCGREQTQLPTLEGFAISLNVDTETIGNWGDKFPEFLGALRKITQYQKQQLINDGIYGGKEVNSTIVKLLLQNNHGMREKVDNTTDGKPLPTPIYGGRSSS